MAKKKIKKEAGDSSVDENQVIFKNVDLILEIEKIIEQFIAFDSRLKENAISFNNFKNSIESLYLYLTIFILSGQFKENNFNSNYYKKLCDRLSSLKEDFEEFHEGDSKDSKLDKILEYIENLISNIGVIYDLNVLIVNKRKSILYIDSIGTRPNDDGYQKLFHIAYMGVIYDIEIVNNHFSKQLSRSLLGNLREIQKVEIKNENYNWIRDILIEKIKYNLLKIAIISKKRYYDIYIEKEIEKIDSLDFKNSFFKPIVEQFQFIYHPEKRSLSDIDEFLKKNVYEDTIALIISIKYYKEKIGDRKKLTGIYNDYKSNLSKNSPLQKYINYVFLGNNLLSLLIKDYGKSSDDPHLKNEIESLFKEITDYSKKKQKEFNNYFTYYKYSLFKLYEYKKQVKKKEFHKAQGILKKGQENLKKTLSLFENGEYHDYFEFDGNANHVLLGGEYNDQLDTMFCFNLYAMPFDIERERENLSQLQENYFKSKLDIDYIERFSDIENKINSHKSEAMTIIGIFTGIVVYSFGTIQLFSIIEDLGSAIMFSGIFLAGIMFIMSTIFYEPNKNILHDKGSKIFLLGLTILILSLIGKGVFSGLQINSNKGENIYNKLNSKIEEAESLKYQIDTKIDYYKYLKDTFKDEQVDLIK